jgi:hypothetical protein
MNKPYTFEMTTHDGEFIGKIDSVKGLRALFHLGLKEAKDLAEEIQTKKKLTRSFFITADEETLKYGLNLCEAGGISITNNRPAARNTLLNELRATAARAVECEQFDIARKLIDILENAGIQSIL